MVALVDGDPISRPEWQKAVALDRLINGRLVLHQTGPKITASGSDANTRLAQLQQGWRADNVAVDRALVSAGLARQDLPAAHLADELTRASFSASSRETTQPDTTANFEFVSS
jgi:hypothetical protein